MLLLFSTRVNSFQPRGASAISMPSLDWREVLGIPFIAACVYTIMAIQVGTDTGEILMFENAEFMGLLDGRFQSSI